MEKTWEHLKEEMEVAEIKRKRRHIQQEQWNKPDEDGKYPSANTNGFTNNNDEIMLELGNTFDKIVHGKKEPQNGYFKGYAEAKMEVQEKSEMNVYYDKEAGIWKCRNCFWTYQNGRQWTEHIEHPKQYLHMLSNRKTVNRHESCFYCEFKGLKSICGFVATENNSISNSTSMKSSKDGLVVTVKRFLSETTNIKRTPFEEISDTNHDSRASLSVTIETKTNTYFEERSQAAKDTLGISIRDHVLFPGKQVEITDESYKNPRKADAGPDTCIMVEDLAEPKATQTPQGITSPHIERVEYERFEGIEVVKSIIYGGFAELIASLGIVSSAVGADTAILKILALGLANLIGGLFIIGHNLWNLKSDQDLYPSHQMSESNSIELTTQQNRYEELLGQRKNFWAHATIALLSYLVFGMLPPVTYAFSFRESENKNYKFIAVAAASLVCIVILSGVKAHIQRPPKAYLKTIIFYIMMVFMTSGVSYAFGDFLKKHFQSLGWFTHGLDFRLPVLEAQTLTLSAWASL